MQMPWKELDDRIYLAANFEKEPAVKIIKRDGKDVITRDGKGFMHVKGRWITRKMTRRRGRIKESNEKKNCKEKI